MLSGKKESSRVEREKFIEERRLPIGKVKLPMKARGVVPGHVSETSPETRKVVPLLRK